MGGSDLALHEAAKYLGIEVEIIAAYDNWDKAVAVYNRNLPAVATVTDINNLDSLPDCDFVFGGPPCQPFSLAGKRLGKKDPRDCSDKTWDLVKDRNYLLENVKYIFDAPYVEKYKASDFGDATMRRRFFHSNLPISGAPVLFGPTTISDIRDYEEDKRIMEKRGLIEKAGNHTHYTEDDVLLGLTAHSWHGHDVRGGKLLNIVFRGHASNNRPVTDDCPFGTISATTYHGNVLSQGCRNPSLLEMQRAHSFPDSWDWGKTNKVDKGKMIANSWPIKMGISVFISFLENLC